MVFSYQQLYELYASTATISELAKYYNVHPDTIYKARKGITYKSIYEEYHDSLEKDVKAGTPFTIPSITLFDRHYYYYYNENLRIVQVSFDDLLFTVPLRKTKRITIDYNTKINGRLISYNYFLTLLKQHVL